MSSYCFSIWGVRRRAIMGASTDWNGSGMRSPSEKRFFRKSCVSGTYNNSLSCKLGVIVRARTVDGPPMLSMTMATRHLSYLEQSPTKFHVPVGLQKRQHTLYRSELNKY